MFSFPQADSTVLRRRVLCGSSTVLDAWCACSSVARCCPGFPVSPSMGAEYTVRSSVGAGCSMFTNSWVLGWMAVFFSEPSMLALAFVFWMRKQSLRGAGFTVEAWAVVGMGSGSVLSRTLTGIRGDLHVSPHPLREVCPPCQHFLVGINCFRALAFKV